MFAAPLSFDGRIGRLEYLLTLLIVFTAILAFIYRPYLINADIEIFINNIEYPLLTLALWFLLAQTIKRTHDFELSSVPFKVLP